MDVFVVMPNHVHGIIIINKTNGYADTTSATGNTDVETQNFASLLRIIKFCISAAHYKKGTLFVKSEPRYPFDIIVKKWDFLYPQVSISFCRDGKCWVSPVFLSCLN
jgi:hypothetical protein